MRKLLTTFIAAILILTGFPASSFADTSGHIKMADAGWDSIRFHNAVVGYIAENGYGLTWEEVPGSTPITYEALKNKEIDVYTEIWTDNLPSYDTDVDQGLLLDLGVNFDDNKQGIYVPTYVIKGDPERGIKPMAPDLKTVSDLKNYADVFVDEENPDKGRLYGAIPGWEADTVVKKKYYYNNLDENFKKVADSTKYAGSMQAEYEARINTTEAKLQLAQNSLTSTAVTLGSVFLPAIKETAEIVGGVAGYIDAFSNTFPTLTKYVTGLLGGVLAANVAIFAMRYAWLSVSLPFQTMMVAYRGYQAWLLTTNGLKLTSAMLTYRQSAAMLFSAGATNAVTIAQWAWNAALTANPIGLVILAIGALVASGIWLINNWDTVKAWFTTLWDNPKLALDQFVDGVKSRFGSALDWVADKWNWVKSIFSNPVNITLQGDGAAKDLPGYASGGRIPGKTLAWFAEKSAEYAIPMDGSNRSVGLWAQAGSELGVLGSTTNSNPISLSYSPVVNVTGNADTQLLMTMFQQQKIEFERMLRDLIEQRERVSFV